MGGRVKADEGDLGPVNEVHLIGRLSGAASERELPSGDVVVTWRLVVDRPRQVGSVDTIDCAAWSAALRKRMLGMPDGAWVEVSGCLRRRFWRAPGGAASRYEVEASSIRRHRVELSRS